VDAFLPASSFAATDGTLINMEGRIQKIVPVERPLEGAVTGLMRPDWRIFSDLAKTLGCSSLDYQTAPDVYREIRTAIPGFPIRANRKPRRLKVVGDPEIDFGSVSPSAEGGFLLVADPGGCGHRGVDLSSKVGGLSELALEEGFRMNPEDMVGLGLQKGNRIRLSISPDSDGIFGQAHPDPECPDGSVFFSKPAALGGLSHRRDWERLFHLPHNPIRIDIQAPSARDGEGKNDG